MSRKTNSIFKLSKSRLNLTLCIFILLYTLLIYRLVDIQIINNGKYTQMVKNQTTEKLKLNTGRGNIYDRNNVLLTDKVKNQVIILEKDRITRDTNILDIIMKNTDLTYLDIYKSIQNQDKTDIVKIQIEDINDAQKSNLKKENIIVTNEYERYDDKNLLSHTIGYIKQADNTGQSGIEKNMEEILQSNNEKYISVFKAGDSGNIEDVEILSGGTELIKEQGDSVKLTIDYELQKTVENIMDKEENPTAVIISDIESGEILTMSSRPNFEQNNIVKYLDEENDKGELMNRVISNTYPAGSVFKIVVLHSALENNIITEDYNYECRGHVEIGDNGEILKCNNLEGHGIQTLQQAFSNSCNTAFFDIANKTGKDKIIETAKKFHLHEKVEIGLEEEVNREIPKDISIRNLSIGQGRMEFTPIQINQMTQIIANNGTYKPLYIYDSVINSNKEVVKIFETSKKEEIISPYTSSIVKEYMKDVSSTGTAKELSELEGGSGVKTGTAQSSIDGNPISHGWITGYYPSTSPKYAITILVEGTKDSSKSAIPIFNDICREINNKS